MQLFFNENGVPLLPNRDLAFYKPTWNTPEKRDDESPNEQIALRGDYRPDFAFHFDDGKPYTLFHLMNIEVLHRDSSIGLGYSVVAEPRRFQVSNGSATELTMPVKTEVPFAICDLTPADAWHKLSPFAGTPSRGLPFQRQTQASVSSASKSRTKEVVRFNCQEYATILGLTYSSFCRVVACLG